MRLRNLTGAAAFGMASAFAGGAQAEIFKCVDAKGRTVYLQSPCPSGSKSSVVKAPPAPQAALEPGAKAAEPPTMAELERDLRKRQQDEEESRKNPRDKRARAKEAQEACARAKEQIARIDAGQISRLNEKGERYYLSDAEVEIEKSKAHAIASDSCG